MFSPSSVNVICFDPMRGLVVRKQGRVNGVAPSTISCETPRGLGVDAFVPEAAWAQVGLDDSHGYVAVSHGMS